jgi:peroxiredoxin (alkyl hydroperoxide reductase subunit C)
MSETINHTDTYPTMLPLIGDKAPAFIAETTQGIINFPEDYLGHWTILFSHPSDFTPVCTTEFIMFAQLSQEFEALNTRLLGLSIDSLSSHIAWLYAIEEQVKFHGLDHINIPFPLIADLSQDVARKYGMIHPKNSTTKTVRAVFFIDPQGTIRTILYYPASTGRNFDEILRILISLQTSDAFDISTPANWRPGDDVISCEATTVSEAFQKATDNAHTTNTWFLSLTSLPSQKIQEKLLHTTNEQISPRSPNQKLKRFSKKKK